MTSPNKNKELYEEMVNLLGMYSYVKGKDL